MLKPRENIFDKMPKYRVCPASDLGDPSKMDKIERCSKPNEHLEIVYSQHGVASTLTKTIPQMFDEAVKNGQNSIVFAVEESESGNMDINAKDMKWKFYNWKDFDKYVKDISRSLIAMGIKPFDIINLLGFCSPLYVMIQVAIIYSGGMCFVCVFFLWFLFLPLF